MVQYGSRPSCLHYDYMSFTEQNGCPTTRLDLAQYVVLVMSTRAQSVKLPGVYIPSYVILMCLLTPELIEEM